MFVVILFVVSVSVCMCVRECAYGAYGGTHVHADVCPHVVH